MTGGATAALGVAAALASTCLAGAPLYTSAAASQALQDQLGSTCASDAALTLPLWVGSAAVNDEIEAIGAQVPLVEPPVGSSVTLVRRPGYSELFSKVFLMSRDGVEQHVVPPLRPLAEGEIAVSTTNLELLAVELGETVTLQGALGATTFVVAQTFDDVPVLPEPAYWCGYDTMLRPTAGGDAPPIWAIVAPATHVRAGGFPVAELEYRPVGRPLTMHEGDRLGAAYAAALTEYSEATGIVGRGLPTSELPRLLSRAHAVESAVAKSIAPVRLAGVAAAGVVGLASAVMLARERRRELRLRALRGEPPRRLAMSVLPATSLPVVVGSAAGFVLAFVGVRAFGPTGEVERGAVTSGALAALAATVVGASLAAMCVAVVGDRSVDAPRRRRRLVVVPVELGVVALAVFSFRRLDEVGGLRLFGLDVRGGELLTQGFALFAVIAAAALVVRPVQWCARRWRTTGARLPRGIRLGWRRVVLEPGLVAALVAASTLAAGCLTVSAGLLRSARLQLDAKALTFTGTDLVMTLFDEPIVPAAFADRTMVVRRYQGRADGMSIDVIGVDRSRFARIAAPEADGSGVGYAELMAAIAPPANTSGIGASGPIPAVVVGGPSSGGSITVETVAGATAIVLDPRVRAAYLPGSQNGRILAIVDATALVERVGATRAMLWVRDPPADAVAQVRATGVRVGPTVAADSVFGTASYSAQRWSYTPLGVLGVLFGAMVVMMQLLLIEARRESRRMAHVVMQPMGFSRRSAWVAAVVEVGVPLVLGTALGTTAGLVAGWLAVPRLDTLPLLAPRARLDVPVASVVALVGAVVIAIVTLATLCVRSSRRGDPMEVMRGTA